MDARVTAVLAGRVRTFPDGGPEGKSWRSAIDKQPVLAPARLAYEGLAGDAQADRRYHGGPARALLGYSAGHYPSWAAELRRADLGPGSFGENLTIEGLDESSACIGDELRLGTAVIQISQPRMPCVKLARRLATPDIVARTLSTARTGFYLRVLEEGDVGPGPLELLGRSLAGLTVARALNALLDPAADPEGVDSLRGCFSLSEHFRAALVKAVDRAARTRPTRPVGV